MKQCGIYGLVNLISDKWYIGQSVDIRKRRYEHFYKLRHGLHGNQHLQFAFLRDGETAFEFRILELLDECLLDARESAWIARYRSNERATGYNLDGGGNPRKHLTDETKRKISVAKKGLRLSAETRRKMSQSRMGHPCSDETRAKISASKAGWRPSAEHLSRLHASNIGRPVSEETRRKRSLSLRGRIFTDEHRRKISEAKRRKKEERNAALQTIVP